MKYFQVICVLLGFCVFSDESAKDYYFPIKELTEGKVYVFTSKETPSDSEYWKLTYHPKKSTLETEAFQSNFEKYELFQEKVTDKGTKAEKIISYVAKDKTGNPNKYSPILIETSVYLWNVEKPWRYSAYFIDDDFGKIIFTKNREFVKDEQLTIDSKVYEVLKFKELYTYEQVSSKEKYSYHQISYYAKGIGLVRVEKDFPQRQDVTLELSKILTLKEWQQLKKAN